MPRTSLVKSAFNSGVLDPRLLSRTDLTIYERGLQQGTNVFVTPYGGLQRRGGLRNIGTPNADPLSDNVRLIPFAYNSGTDQYLLAFCSSTALGAIIRFYKNDALITNINGSGLSYMASPWTSAMFAGLRFAQTADVMVMLHEDQLPKTIIRGTADNLWTIASITFAAIPQIDFNDASSPAPTSEVQTITFASAGIGDNYKLDLEGVQTDNIVFAGDVLANDQAANSLRIQRELAKLYNTGDGDIVVARTGALTYQVTFQNGAARSYLVMTGYLVTGTIAMTIVRTTPGVTRSEPLWSAGRGYPRTVCFWESRLVFGGFKSRPQTVALSVTNDPYNFQTGEALDDDAIVRTLQTNQQNRIVAVIPSKHLQVFTEGGEFFFPNLPLTPADSGALPQTNYGCSARVYPVQLDGMTHFLEEKGRGLRQFLFQEIEQAYQGPSTSRRSSFLLNSPVDMAVTQSSKDEEGSYLYLVNGDGTVAVMMSERSEEVLAWTPWETSGKVLAVAVLTDEVYFLVRYSPTESSGTYRHSLVKVDRDYYTDDSTSTTGASTSSWSVGSTWNGLTLNLVGDGQALVPAIVSSGTITLLYPVTTLEYGLGFNTTIQPMPAAFISQNFAGQNRPSRLCQVYAQVRSSLGLICDGYPMDNRFIGVSPLNTAVDAVSGVVLWTVNGWGENLAPTITQTTPQPLTLLSLEYELEMH